MMKLFYKKVILMYFKLKLEGNVKKYYYFEKYY